MFENAACGEWSIAVREQAKKEAEEDPNRESRDLKLDATDGIKFADGAVFEWLELDALDLPLFHCTLHGICYKALRLVEKALKQKRPGRG